MSDPRLHNPLLQLQGIMEELSPEWERCYNLLDSFKEKLRDWMEAPAFSDKQKNLCNLLEELSSPIVESAKKLTNLVEQRKSLLTACTPFLNNNKQLKKGWADYLAQAMIQLDHIWQFLERQEIEKYVPEMVAHCKDVSRA